MFVRVERTVCVAGPLAAAGARLMTCIWAAARVATMGSALMYFIMTMSLYLRERERNVTAWAGYTVVVD